MTWATRTTKTRTCLRRYRRMATAACRSRSQEVQNPRRMVRNSRRRSACGNLKMKRVLLWSERLRRSMHPKMLLLNSRRCAWQAMCRRVKFARWSCRSFWAGALWSGRKKRPISWIIGARFCRKWLKMTRSRPLHSCNHTAPCTCLIHASSFPYSRKCTTMRLSVMRPS